jgi:hypothetical protein
MKIRIYKTIIAPLVLHGCDTWSLTLREERRLMVCENRVLRKTFWPKRDEVTGWWRKPHNELCDLYSSPSKIKMKPRRMRWAGHIGRMEKKRDACRLLVGKPEGNRPQGRPKLRREDNIKLDLGEIRLVAWTVFVWLRVGTSGERFLMR